MREIRIHDEASPCGVPYGEVSTDGASEGFAVMTKQTFGSVWDAIEDTPAEAENMKIRSSLMLAIIEHIRAHKWTQTEAAKQLGVTQRHISNLMRSKIHFFSADALIAMAGSAGLTVRVKVSGAS